MTFPKRFALISSILAASCAVWGAYELFTFAKKPHTGNELGKSSFPKFDRNDLRKGKASLRELKLIPCDPSLLSQTYFLKGPQYEKVESIEIAEKLSLSPLFSITQTPLIANTAPPWMFEHHQIQKWALPIQRSMETTASSVAYEPIPDLKNVDEISLSSQDLRSPDHSPQKESQDTAKLTKPIRQESLTLSPYLVPFSPMSLNASELPNAISKWDTPSFALKVPHGAIVTLSSYDLPTVSFSISIAEERPLATQPLEEVYEHDLSKHFASLISLGKESTFQKSNLGSPKIEKEAIYVVCNHLRGTFLEALHEKASLPISILEQLPQTEDEQFFHEDTLPLSAENRPPRIESVKRIARKNTSPVNLAPIFAAQKLDFKIQERPVLLVQSKKIDELQNQAFTHFLMGKTTSSNPFVEADLLSDVQIDEWQDQCNFTLQYMKDPYGNGYFFVVSVEPNFTTTENNLHQNIYFLVDRSNSIEKHRYQTFKKAVSRALRELDVSDHFNILLFDHQVMAFQKESIPATTTNIEKAENFLEAQGHTNFLSAGDVYKSLRHLIPTKIDTRELHSAILITDGNSLLTTAKKQKAIQQWKDQFGDSVNLFTAAVGKGNNLNLLSLFSSFGQGKMVYSDTHASFPRKVAAAVRGMKSPLAKNLHAFVKSSASQVDLLTDNQFTPPLFNEQPVIFLGYAQELSDFTFVLEGKNKDGWFEIRKNFSFSNGKATRAPVEKAVELHRAQIHYRRFFEKGLEKDLDDAEDCLKSAESRWNFD